MVKEIQAQFFTTEDTEDTEIHGEPKAKSRPRSILRFRSDHRQYIVNLDKVKEIASLPDGSYILTMINGGRVEVSRRRSRRLLDALK